jgi:virginiamycin B lyase
MIIKFLPLLLLFSLLLAACGDPLTQSSDIGPIDSPASSNSPTVSPAIMAIGKFLEFALPQTNSGLMRPAIDHEGRIWFGEMSQNYLAVLDPRIHKFQQMKPPHGQSGIMGVEVASDDTIWFAEQYADYIGHYFPKTGHYQIYALPSLTVPDPSDASKTLTLPSAPNDLALDKEGNVWFTELNADAIGRIDPRSGSISQYPLSAKKSVQTLDPYGISVDSHGMVWFTESGADRIGRLDPSTGHMSFFIPPISKNAALMEIISGTHNTIWITTFNSSLLSFDPVTDNFRTYNAPAVSGSASGSGGLYGVIDDPTTGDLWVTVAAQNVIGHLDVASGRFTYYAIPTSGSLPLGIVAGVHNTFWFTEAEGDKIGMLQV